jgi:hypothetical protein
VSAKDDELPVDWLLTEVKQVGSVRLGRQRSPEKTIGSYPTKYIRAANITDRGFDLSDVLEMDFTPAERPIYQLIAGDILLVEGSGSPRQVGKSAVWQEEVPNCCFQNTVIRFRPHAATAGYSSIVFRHFLMSGIFAEVARGVGIMHLSASRFSVLPFPLPPQDTQRLITSEVDRRTAELREAETSLRSALVSIEAQKVQILALAADGNILRDLNLADSTLAQEGELIVSAALRGGDQGTFEFDSDPRSSVAELEEQYPWLSPLPAHWIWVRVDEIAEVQLGRMRSPKYAQGPNMRPYLRVANVHEDRIDTSDILSMNFTPEEYDVYHLQIGDVLLNDGQSPELVGRPAMYRGEVPGACFQNHILRFRSTGRVDPDFALLVFRSYLHSGKFQAVARWTTNIATLSATRFSAMPFPLPPLDVQREIVVEARQRLDASAAQEAAVRQSLKRLPDFEREMLSMAVSGSLIESGVSEESAAALLARLGPPPDEPRPQRQTTDREADIAMESLSGVDASSRPLAEVLARAERPMALPDLLLLAGFDKDSGADVERFYLALRAEVGRTIRVVSNVSENAIVELMPDASY